MASYTPNLDLLKKSPVTDGNDTFNVDTMLNENWDKIDAATGNCKAPAKKLGLTGDLSVGASLGVLATVGDLHVWRRTQTVGSGGYKLVNAGQQLITGTLQSADQSQTINYSDSITVTEESISLSGSVSSVNVSYNSYENANVLKGKFFQNPSAGNTIYYAPENTAFNRASNPGPTYNVYATSLSTPEYVPPGTYTDYPVSTNPNAYQAGSDAQPAGYVLGDEKSLTFAYSGFNSSAIYADSISVQEDGTLLIDGPSEWFEVTKTSVNEANSLLRGKFIRAAITRTGPTTTIKYLFIPSTAIFSLSGTKMVLDKCQEVTGYPAIPAGTTIEYLGKLGDKTRMQIVSYVGTGTYGASNPCSITADFPIDLSIMLGYIEDDPQKSFIVPHVGRNYMIGETLTQSFVESRGFYSDTAIDNGYGKISEDKKNLSWYALGSEKNQFNKAGFKYYVLNIKF